MTVSDSKVTLGHLKFKKPIISTVNEPIPTKELLNRLQILTDELSAVHQDQVDIESFSSIKKELANKKLLKHANVGVQAYVCCGISDILRIYAPDAPFTATELSQIFKAFFQQFKKLADTENPYFQQQNYLLKRLAEVRSVILMTDLPDAQQLIESIFEIFYDLSTKKFPSRLEPLVSDILSEIISESDVVPHNVLKMILNKFLTNFPEESAITSGLKSNISNPGFNFSLSICEANLDRMSRQVAQFFSEMLYDSTSNVEKAENKNDHGNSSIDKIDQAQAIESLRKIHKLSIQIWKAIPELLASVMGLFNDELNTDDEKIRILATETIGKMIGASSSVSVIAKANFIIAHRETWLNWLKKTLDVSPAVRCKWVELLPQIINSSNSSTSDIATELCNGLTKCLLDTDERVRLTACISIERIPFDKFTNRVCNKNIMSTLSQLIREKNPEIRNEIIKILGNFYNQYFEAKANNRVLDFGSNNEIDSKELEKSIYYGVPNQIISLIYINDKNITSAVDICIFEKLFPFESNSIKRVDRLAQLFNNLNEKSKLSFFAINKRQRQISNVLQTFVEMAESYSKLGSINDSNEEKENMRNDSDKFDSDNSRAEGKRELLIKMDKIINWLCVSFPDGLNTYACLERFYKLKNFRFFYLIKVCISPESDYNTIKNSMKELLNKLTNAKNIRLEDEKSNVSTTDMVSNFKLLLYRASVILYNKSNMTELINYSKESKHEWNSAANEILENVSVLIPDVLKFHVSNLTEILVNDEGIINKDSEVSISNNLRTIYHFIKKFPDLFPSDLNFTESLKSLAVDGSPREAKYSIKILGLSSKKELYGSAIINSIYPLDVNHKRFVTHLSAIAELFLVDPLSVEDLAGDLTVLLIKEILLQNRKDDEENAIGNEKWIDDFKLDSHFESYSTLYEKVLALRIFVNRLKSIDKSFLNKSELTQEATSVAQPIFKLLLSIIGNGGEIVKEKAGATSTPKIYQLKLRLISGLYLLKLAKCPIFNDMFNHSTINRLIYLLQDQNDDVRHEFLMKLEKNLSNESISERFLPLIFFMGHEPKLTLKSEASIWIKSMYKRKGASNNMKFERSIVRLIHTIVHNDEFSGLMKKSISSPDSKEQQDQLIRAYSYALEYIIFYLLSIGKSENCSLLYYFASRIKQYRDATIDQSLYDIEPLPQEVLSIYCIAELTQLIIKELCDLKSWTLQTWPGKIQLSSDLFAPMTSTKEAHDIITRIYIADNIQIKLRSMFKLKISGTGLKRKSNDSNDIVKKPKVKVNATSSKPKSKLKLIAKLKKKSDSKSSDKYEEARKSNRSRRQVNYVEEEGSSSDPNEDSDEYSD
ncbi:uncharacterized protein AC631_00245 [Debaryomyces fabryi]|uniref:Sister chromatid cohesion protein PDS5 n=1 Tax=Debaryomyces fabryi TaxID=58627 RepID=A0A0V1Q698_9ASCO|nr:uncharacterized protein AC631_00245 [Debaryomyces fabryi]KSA03975.1 hypothetical protein AC631_00245 [Debaryomyces fabryi]CUM53820.1 unnamed protein product [Debaryomyces fabryi]